jgi:hypothetical protein
MRGYEDPSVYGRYTKYLEPASPCIVQQEKMLSVVGHQDPATLCCGQEMLIISSTLQTYVTCGNSHVTNLAEKECNLQRNIVVGVKAGHRALRCVSSNASVNEVLMPSVVRDGSFHSFTRQGIVRRYTGNIASHSTKVRDNRPDGHPILLDTGCVQTRIMRILLDVTCNDCVILHC